MPNHSGNAPTAAFETLVVRLDSSLKAQLRVFAEANNLSISEATRQVLTRALAEDGSQIDALAYNDGLRRGLADAKTAISRALAALWR